MKKYILLFLVLIMASAFTTYTYYPIDGYELTGIKRLKRLELIKANPQFKEKLWTIVKALQNGFKERGFDIGVTESCVTPVFLHGDYNLGIVTNLIRDMREKMNVFCSIIIYPVVPKGVILLRIIPTASHTLEDVSYTMECFEEVQRKLKAGEYASETPVVA